MKQSVEQTISDAVKSLFDLDVSIKLERPDSNFGDYASNVAMQLAGQLKAKPRDIADKLAKKVAESENITSVEVAGPGFLNITLTDGALLEMSRRLPKQTMKGQKVLIEYSDPNPFKPLHAGHLYTTLVGDVLSRIVENAGAETVRLNFGGDVGMHVGKTMWAVLREIGGEDFETVKDLPVESLGIWMGQRYVEGNAAYDESEELKHEIKEVNKRVYQLHADNDHDTTFAQIYWYLREQSYEFFKKLYEELQVKSFDRFIPESEVAEMGLKTVQQNTPSVFKESDGATVFDGEQFGLHTRVFINSEGLPTYEAKDVGLSLTKWNDYHPNKSIIITANEQKQYMEVVLKAIEQFESEAAEATTHLTHGVVKLAGGVKMSSRKGNILSAFDILSAAREAGKNSGQAENEDVMLAAVKYAFAKNRIGGDIIYNPEESIAMEGNSGPYLQYAHARARSILRKSGLNQDHQDSVDSSDPLENSERILVRKIGEYSEVLEQTTADLQPHLVCTYLYELAQTFNRFYEQTKVIGSEREIFRIWLVKSYADTLKNGLNLLGIKAPEQM